jgi:hypothetical protein
VAWGTMYRGGVGWNEIIDDECYGRLFIFRVRDGALRFALGILRYIIPSLAKLTSPLPKQYSYHIVLRTIPLESPAMPQALVSDVPTHYMHHMKTSPHPRRPTFFTEASCKSQFAAGSVDMARLSPWCERTVGDDLC